MITNSCSEESNECTNHFLSVSFGLPLLQKTPHFNLGTCLPTFILYQRYAEVCSDTLFSNYLFVFYSPLYRFWFIYLCFSVTCIFSNLSLVIKVLNSKWYMVRIESLDSKISNRLNFQVAQM